MAMRPDNFFDDALIRGTVTIANGQTTSTQIDTRGASIIMIKTPIAIEGGCFTFLVSVDNGETFSPYHSGGGCPVKVRYGPDRAIGITATDFLPATTVKIVSDVPQSAERILDIIIRGVV